VFERTTSTPASESTNVYAVPDLLLKDDLVDVALRRGVCRGDRVPTFSIVVAPASLPTPRTAGEVGGHAGDDGGVDVRLRR
jgi:hypothetical protein